VLSVLPIPRYPNSFEFFFNSLGALVSGHSASVCLFFLLLFPNQPIFSVDVILPTIPWPWLSTLPCLLIILNLFMHYYFACTVSPGFASDLPHLTGNSFIWAKKRQTSRRPLTNGVRWSVDLNMTPAAIGRCSKCGGSKPEVRQPVVVGAKTTLLIF
jgi:hypothetical protein